MNGTKRALELWEQIEPQFRLRLLNNVWCGACCKTSGITEINATVVDKSNLLLQDICTVCGGEVARYIESE
jgi:hypothetical protein